MTSIFPSTFDLYAWVRFLLFSSIFSFWAWASCFAQAKIILLRYRCSRITDEKTLYDAMKGSKGVIEAERRINGFFNDRNGDYFTLLCTEGCESPRRVEFPAHVTPEPRNNVINTGTAFQWPKEPIGVQIAIGPENSYEAKDTQWASELFSMLSSKIPIQDTAIHLIRETKTRLNFLVPGVQLQARYYKLQGEIGWNRFDDDIANKEPKRINYLINLVDPAGEVVESWNSSDLDLLVTRNPWFSPAHVTASQYPDSWFDKPMSAFFHTEDEKSKKEIDYLASIVSFDLSATLHPLERDTLTVVYIEWMSNMTLPNEISAEIQSAIPVTKVEIVGQHNWKLTAACRTDCLFEMIQEMDAAKKYEVKLEKDRSIVLTTKK
jgi:hypothetical protein